MIALLNPWGPSWALSGASQTLRCIAELKALPCERF